LNWQHHQQQFQQAQVVPQTSQPDLTVNIPIDQYMAVITSSIEADSPQKMDAEEELVVQLYQSSPHGDSAVVTVVNPNDEKNSQIPSSITPLLLQEKEEEATSSPKEIVTAKKWNNKWDSDKANNGGNNNKPWQQQQQKKQPQVGSSSGGSAMKMQSKPPINNKKNGKYDLKCEHGNLVQYFKTDLKDLNRPPTPWMIKNKYGDLPSDYSFTNFEEEK
jgi:hypothetical protein